MPQEDKDFVPITLRIPKKIHGRLKDLSDEEYRSLNQQIIMALTYFVDMQERFGTLPSPDHVRRSIPDNGKAYPSWLKTSTTTGRGSAR